MTSAVDVHTARPATANDVPSELAALIEYRARHSAAQPFLVEAATGGGTDYQSLAAAVNQWHRAFDRERLTRGTAVLLAVSDPLQFVAAYLGLIAAGRCAVPVDPAAPFADLARTAAHTHSQYLISDRPELGPQLGLPRIVAAARPGLGVGTVQPAVTEGIEDGAVRLSTSGSTGEPKVVELSARQLLHVATEVARHHELTTADRCYCSLPLFHINAEVIAVLATLVSGGTLVLDRKFRPTAFWATVDLERITWVNAVPAVYAILARTALPVAPAPLRFLRSASAPLPIALRARLEREVGRPVVESYGMTEASSQITATALDGSSPPGSVGRPIGVRLQVRGPDGVLVPPGESGRIWLRGDGVISRYAHGRAADRFEGGWLDTGDRGRLDNDGNLYHEGRADEVINRGGELIYPREIEEVLAQHPLVSEAVVTSRPDEVLGEVPIAFVLTTSGGAELAELLDELTRHCEAQLSRYKRPAEIRAVADLPRAATGKVRRHQLREWAR